MVLRRTVSRSFATKCVEGVDMSRPAKNPAITFDDAMTVHVLRAEGFTFSELCGLFGDHASRIIQILDGTLHPGSWEAALDKLERGVYWHPRIVALVLSFGGPQPMIAATKAANPAHRRHQQELKRLRKISIPFCRRASRLGSAA
jgi:hypothetical protein